MRKSCFFLLTAGLIATAGAQQQKQTPPIQPKTVESPALAPLVIAGPPKGEGIVNAPLSADEAVRIALAHQPQLTISQAAAQAAAGQRIQTQALLNPTVTITSSGSVVTHLNSGSSSTGFVSGAPQAAVNGSIQLDQLIFDFNRTRDQVRQAQATEAAAFRTYDQTRQDTAFTVRQDYYSLAKAKAQADVAEANVKSRQAQVDLTQAQVSAGLGEPADLVSAKTLLDQGALQLSQANQAVVNASVALAQAMGIDPRTPIKVQTVAEAEQPLDDSNALVDIALKQRPEILSAEESLRAAGYGVSVARKATMPSLSFAAGVSGTGTYNPFVSTEGFLTVSLNWSIFDGGAMVGKVRQAKAEQDAARASLLQISQSVVSDVANAWIGVKASLQQIDQAKAEVANAEEGVRLAEGRYRAGVTTFQEIITAQANLVTAQTDQVNSVTALSTEYAALDHAVGRKY